MRDYSTLSDAEVNAKLAEKMGWDKEDPDYWWNGIDAYNKKCWSPCTSRDDLVVVLSEVHRCVLDDNLDDILWEIYGEQSECTGSFIWFYCLTCPPRIIAEACLEVLEG